MTYYKVKVICGEEDTIHLSPMIKMSRPIPGKKITWMTILVCLFQMTVIFVTSSSLRIQMLEAITFRKSEIWSYPLYTLVVKNSGSSQAKQNPPFKIHHTPRALTYVKLISEIPNTRQRLPQTTF